MQRNQNNTVLIENDQLSSTTENVDEYTKNTSAFNDSPFQLCRLISATSFSSFSAEHLYDALHGVRRPMLRNVTTVSTRSVYNCDCFATSHPEQ